MKILRESIEKFNEICIVVVERAKDFSLVARNNNNKSSYKTNEEEEVEVKIMSF